MVGCDIVWCGMMGCDMVWCDVMLCGGGGGVVAEINCLLADNLEDCFVPGWDTLCDTLTTCTTIGTIACQADTHTTV